MLLILCDVWKAAWFALFPIIGFFSGRPVESSSTFCQASGFSLAVGTEACDIVILMIAVHTALYVFRSQAPGCGLYRYRKPAYASLIIVPLFLASVPFAGGPGYVNVGGYCYLPARPDVYRLALSWVPRYLIFTFILITYVSLYTYVRMLMHRYAAESNTSRRGTITASRSDLLNGLEEEYIMPSKLPCAYNGLALPSTSQPTPAQPGSRGSIDIDRPHTFGESRRKTTSDLQNNAMDKSMSRFQSLSWVNRSATLNSSATSNSLLSGIPWTKTYQSCSPRCSASFGRSESQMGNDDVEGSPMAKQRDKVSRQLQILFVYPVVYMFMWIMPFVLHVLTFSDRFARLNNQQLPLLLLSLISLTAQGVVDCWLFAIREKPWKHAHKGFWEAFACKPRPAARHAAKGPGRTREEMMVDVRLARARRDGELAEREHEMIKPLSLRTQRRRHKEWWEVGVGTGDTRWSQMPPPPTPRPSSDEG